MSIGTSTALAPVVSTRKVPRYKLTVPLALTVLRSGLPDSIPGRTLEIGEGGLGVVAASRLLLGESVRVEFLLPHMNTPVRATAVVRYQAQRCFGLQFLRLPDEHQSQIRYWTRHEADILLGAQKPQPARAAAAAAVSTDSAPILTGGISDNRSPRIPLILTFSILAILLAVALGWWRWQQGWTELEGQVPPKEIVVVEPQLKVPAEAMRHRLTHQVTPEYPEAARRAGVQGTVVLDAVVNEQGTVTQLKPVSGPDALSSAAMDAVRWWRYEPYGVNGQPATVETTVIVDFRLAN
jgi:TonB family protein